MEVKSILILKHPKGYIAHVRFENKIYNEDLSSINIYDMYNKIEYTVYKRKQRLT